MATHKNGFNKNLFHKCQLQEIQKEYTEEEIKILHERWHMPLLKLRTFTRDEKTGRIITDENTEVLEDGVDGCKTFQELLTKRLGEIKEILEPEITRIDKTISECERTSKYQGIWLDLCEKKLRRLIKELVESGIAIYRVDSNNLCSVDFRFSDLQRMNFSGANLWGALLDGANCLNTHFDRSDCRTAHFIGSSCEGANFSNASCAEAHFEGVYCQRAEFSYADCEKTYFSDTICDNAKFYQARCRNAHFEGSSCKEVDFNSAKCKSTHFENGTFEDTSFLSAKLIDAYLDGSKCLRTQFNGADCRFAHFDNATVDEASLGKTQTMKKGILITE